MTPSEHRANAEQAATAAIEALNKERPPDDQRSRSEVWRGESGDWMLTYQESPSTQRTVVVYRERGGG